MRRWATLALVALVMRVALGIPIPPELKDIVTFVFIETNGDRVPNGTGFFVGVPNEKAPDRMHVYLVTSTHVLEDRDGKRFRSVWVRLNKRDGDVGWGQIELQPQAGGKRVYTHHDEGVDLAVVPALPDEKAVSFKFLGEDFLLTKESFKALDVSEGTDVFFTGLFMAHYGEHKNYPIFRFGHVAMMSDEPVLWKDKKGEPGKKVNVFLFATQSFGGNSGSPVFFYLGADRRFGSLNVSAPIIKLAGVMKGTFQEGNPIQVAETGAVPYSVANVGIAAVVPSYFLRDILYSEELVKQREK